MIFDCKFDDGGRQYSGETTIFYDSKRVRYHGKVLDGIYNGKGKLYADNKSSVLNYTGIWKDGIMVNGEYSNKLSNSIKYFKGDYKNNIPYSGEIEVSRTHEFKGAYGFKGTIFEGKLIKGFGHKFNKNYFDKEFLQNHPEYEYRNYDDEYEDDYQHEEIPQEIENEMHENSIRGENENNRECLRADFGQVIELIEAKWEDGECEVLPDDLLYKTYFAMYKK
ncbi:hypothetical protein [Clostridium sp.]|uniref:hypothetical protein n=1 Tax=Clostridium sp. TaxID=1506 RepID=UPI001A3A3BE0|nr:hypothetical protein [Clostridium sp.]MBK5243259.1 hypothetical protein [Clostridium sp.]